MLARALKEQGRTVNCLLLSSSRSEDAQIQHKLSENWGVSRPVPALSAATAATAALRY